MVLRLLIAAVLVTAPSASLAGGIYTHTADSGAMVLSDVPASSSRLVSFEPRQVATSGKRLDSYQRIIDTKADKYSLDPSLIRAVIKVESDFNERAVSRRGALGLMQLMPKTALDMGVRNPMNPEQNIEGGTRYLKHLINKFDGDLRLALAAYNAGPSNVEKYGTIPPISETIRYVKKVFEHYKGRDRLPARQKTTIYKVVLEDGTIVYTDTKTDPKEPTRF